jgi:hypothetical protein
MKKILVIILLFILPVYLWWEGRPVTHGPGIIAPDEPLQEEIVEETSFPCRGYTLTPLARFAVKARVLGKKKYSFDRESDLAQFDLALGWGRMSDESVLKYLKIGQMRRYYFWSCKELPIPEGEICTHSCNMHIIPANDLVLAEIKKIRKGDLVKFSGYLISAKAADGWTWSSSMTRSDTGRGACEVVYTENVNIIRKQGTST